MQEINTLSQAITLIKRTKIKQTVELTLNRTTKISEHSKLYEMAVVPWVYSNPFIDRKTLTSQQFTFFGQYVEIGQVPDVDINLDQNTGLKLWDGSYLLASYVEKHLPLAGKTCLELGAGCGLVSLVAVLAGAKVVATDLPEILPRMEHSITTNLNRINQEINIKCAALDWNNPTDFKPKTSDQFDVILGSDIVYHPDLIDPLIKTLNCLTTDKTDIYMSYKPRGLGEDCFFNKLNLQGFLHILIDKSYYPKDFSMSHYVIYKIWKL